MQRQLIQIDYTHRLILGKTSIVAHSARPFGVMLRSLIFPVLETTAVNPKSSPESSLMITVDSPLISTSSGDIQRALLNVGRTTFPTLFRDALKAVASFARIACPGLRKRAGA